MLNGYKDKEKYEDIIKNTANLESEKLRAEEYRGKLRKVKRHITYLKSKATARIKECEKYCGEIDNEVEIIETRYKNNEYSNEEFSERSISLTKQKQLLESAIKILKDIHDTKSSKDIENLADIEEQPDIQTPPIKDEPSTEQAPAIPEEPPAIQTLTIAEKSPAILAPTIIEETSAIQVPPVIKEPPTITLFPGKKATIKTVTSKGGCWSSIIFVLIALSIIGLIIWGLIAGIGALVNVIGAQISQTQHAPSIGNQAPNFVLQDLNNQPVSLQDYHGKQVVLYLWSISCPYCKSDLAWIQRLSDSSDDKIIKFLTINNQDSISSVKEYLNNNRYSFPILFDIKGSIFKQYNIRDAIPLTILIGPDGNVKNIKAGAFQDEGELREFAGEGVSSPFDKKTPAVRKCPTIGDAAPDFALPSTTGTSVSLNSLRGKNVFINLWTLSCHFDIQDMAYIDELLKNDKPENLEIITVNISDSKTEIDRYMSDNHYSYTVLIDTENEIFNKYCLKKITPVSILIDSNGAIQSIRPGVFNNKNELLCFLNNSKCLTGNQDRNPPIITEPTIFKITPATAIIKWTTNEKSTSEVICIPEDNATPVNAANMDLTSEHSLQIDDLKPDTSYYVSVLSKDPYGNVAQINKALQFKTLKMPPIGSKTGYLAPDFTLETVEGNTVSLEKYKGYKLMIVFMKTLTEPSTYQLKFIEKAYEYVQYQKYEFIVISPSENKQKVRQKTLSCPYIIAFDDTGEITAKYKPTMIPCAYFIDETGLITGKKVGYFASADEIIELTIKDPNMLARLKDKQPPVINNISCTNISETEATIKWDTDEETTDQVQYWIDYSDKITTELNKNVSSTHEVIISPLLADKTYQFIVISKDIAGNETKSEMGIFTTKPAPFVEKANVRVGNRYVKGGDGHDILLINNPNATNPTWQELVNFLTIDDTDKIKYEKGEFICGDFAESLHNNAEKAGIKSAFVCIILGPSSEYPSGGGHALNAFDVIGQGVIFIDDTGSCAKDACPRDLDTKVDLKVGNAYIPQSVFPEYKLKWSSMGEILEITAIQW